MSATNTKLTVGAIALAVGLLVGLEGYPGKPYYDVAGILTDCYGNTKNVRPDLIRSQAECKALMHGEAERIAKFIIKDQPEIPESVLFTGISFVYNVGDGAYRGSTYRKKLIRKDYIGACNEMHKWKYITVRGRKVVSKGLVNRRVIEVRECLKGL